MKKLIPLSILLTSFSTFADYGKPELIARFSDRRAWNAPDNTWCFSGEPTGVKGRVYLQCSESGSAVMMEFSSEKNQILARSKEGNLFSHPIIQNNLPTWYESNEYSVVEAYKGSSALGMKALGFGTDSFTSLPNGSWFFRSKGETPELHIWKNEEISVLFNEKVSFIFSPYVSQQGEIAIKTREVDYSENSPDKIWLYNGKDWKVVLEDTASNPASPWKGFRNQLAVSQGTVIAFSQDQTSEVLLMVRDGKTKVLARAGKDVRSFDYFSPKIFEDTVVFRGMDFENRKVTYVYNGGEIQKLITQGDLVQTDLGDGRVHYQNQDAIFYGAAGFDERGNIMLQATLVDDSSPNTLLGIGLIRFNKE